MDGNPGSGVNRGVNLTDYSGGQYLNLTEGIYQAGECAHCHEMHSSFGGGGSIGGIHGNNGFNASQGWPGSFTYNTATFIPATNRLLNGPAWSGVTFSSTTAPGTCSRLGGIGINAALNSCTAFADGAFTSTAMYNY